MFSNSLHSQVISLLPQCHKNVFNSLTEFLRELLRHSSHNRLDVNILGRPRMEDSGDAMQVFTSCSLYFGIRLSRFVKQSRTCPFVSCAFTACNIFEYKMFFVCCCSCVEHTVQQKFVHLFKN